MNCPARRRAALISLLALFLAMLATEPRAHAAVAINVRDRGAVGDGLADDTDALNAAVEACAAAGGGQVTFPPGRYLSGTIRLRSGVNLELAPGARIVGITNLARYRQPTVPASMPEAGWGKWHRALLLGEDIEDVTIGGSGTIDGNKVFDPTGEERMRGPHALVLVNARRVTVRDVTLLDAANYGVYAQVSDDLEFLRVRIIGGWDGIHWRGAPDRWCRNVRIIGCQIYTGDDAIAGRYWENTLIAQSLLNSSCNGLRLIGPARRLTVSQCLFRGPGEQPHRTSREQRRTNMLSGIILQPGAWDATRGPLDDVVLADNTMENVASPVTLWTKPGNPVGRVTISGLTATGVYRSACSVESWAEEPIGQVVLRNLSLEFTGGGRAEQAGQPVKGPGVDARPLPAWALYARHVRSLVVEDARFSLTADDQRPVVRAEDVEHLRLDHVRFPLVVGVAQPLSTTNVARFESVGVSLPGAP